MKTLWEKLVDGQNMPQIQTSGCLDKIKMLSNDFSYVAKENNAMNI